MSVSLSACLSPLLRSQFSLNFDETVHRSLEPKSYDRVRWGLKSDHSFLTFPPIFHSFRNALSMAVTVKVYTPQFRALNSTQIMVFDSSKDASHTVNLLTYLLDAGRLPCGESIQILYSIVLWAIDRIR